MNRPAHLLKEQFVRILGSLRRRRFEDDFDEELEAHLALFSERFAGQGLSPNEARHAARKQFGGVTQRKGELRDRSRFRPPKLCSTTAPTCFGSYASRRCLRERRS